MPSPRETVRNLLRVHPGAGVEVPLATRDVVLPAILQALNVRRAAEVGVEAGRYSETLCQAVPGLDLLCVDAWLAYPGYREHVTQEKLDALYAEARARLSPYDCRIVKGFSTVVARSVLRRSLDFLYLDANHTLPHVIADLDAWSPKVKAGGVIAGHDFGRGRVGHVREAVHAWTTAYGIDEWYVLAGDRSPSFLWVVA